VNHQQSSLVLHDGELTLAERLSIRGTPEQSSTFATYFSNLDIWMSLECLCAHSSIGGAQALTTILPRLRRRHGACTRRNQTEEGEKSQIPRSEQLRVGGKRTKRLHRLPVTRVTQCYAQSYAFRFLYTRAVPTRDRVVLSSILKLEHSVYISLCRCCCDVAHPFPPSKEDRPLHPESRIYGTSDSMTINCVFVAILCFCRWFSMSKHLGCHFLLLPRVNSKPARSSSTFSISCSR
jgi:hypothetical protein